MGSKKKKSSKLPTAASDEGKTASNASTVTVTTTTPAPTAAPSSNITETLDDLHFEDPYEDELDDEEQRLKEMIIRKEVKKRQQKLLQQQQDTQTGKETMTEEQHDNDNDTSNDKDEQEEEDEDEEEYDVSETEEVESKDSSTSSPAEKKKQNTKYVWRASDGMSTEEQLDYDSTAYSMLHRLRVEWPCLSFDVLPDSLGAQRMKYPQTVYLVAGTQADTAKKNKVTIMKVRQLHKTKHDDSDDSSDEEEEEEGDEHRVATDNKSMEEESDDEDDEDVDQDPIVEERSIAHHGAVNRLRISPTNPHLVATLSDTGKAHIYDISKQVKALETTPSTSASSNSPATAQQHALFTFHGHKEEGYAVSWSKLTAGRLITGDCANGIYLWEPNSSLTSWTVSSTPFKGHTASVEDVAWSPSESTVFGSASADKTIRMWDIRMNDKCAAFIAAHRSDVNVISWNELRQHLLASGSDDGSMKVWDLRAFKSHTPAATFTWHQQPITSIEWHPQEDSILALASEDNSVTIWDMSLETDAQEMALYRRGAQMKEEVPPQLFMVHAGQQNIKELHWHRQIPSVLISTAQDGFNIFKADNMG